MAIYLIRKAGSLIPALFILTTFTFIMLRLTPGNFADAALRDVVEVTPEMQRDVEMRYGLDKSPIEQYGLWMAGMIRGDLGDSFYFRQPVTEVVWARLPVTLELMLGAVLVAVPLGILTGVISALRRNSLTDYGLRLLVLTGGTVPNFVIGIALIYVLLTRFSYTPPLQFIRFTEAPLENLGQFSWAVMILALRPLASISRLTRSQVLEVLNEDYVRTATAKGLNRRAVVWRHVLPNAMTPVFGLMVTVIGSLVAGTVIVELLFSLPGMGRGLLLAIQNRDYPLVQGLVLLFGSLFVVMSLMLDIVVARIDPRIRMG